MRGMKYEIRRAHNAVGLNLKKKFGVRRGFFAAHLSCLEQNQK